MKTVSNGGFLPPSRYIPQMDVYDKIQYTSPVSGEVGTWLVKSISYNFQNFTMTVNASRFYESEPFGDQIVEQR